MQQVINDFGNMVEESPIVHPEIDGRGFECAHSRTTYDYTSRCEGVLTDMESLYQGAYSLRYRRVRDYMRNSFGAKFERRVRDYMRSYRMGVASSDLIKISKAIKTHRNMIDYHHNFYKSNMTDGAGDAHGLSPDNIRISLSRPNVLALSVSLPIFPNLDIIDCIYTHVKLIIA